CFSVHTQPPRRVERCAVLGRDASDGETAAPANDTIGRSRSQTLLSTGSHSFSRRHHHRHRHCRRGADQSANPLPSCWFGHLSSQLLPSTDRHAPSVFSPILKIGAFPVPDLRSLFYLRG